VNACAPLAGNLREISGTLIRDGEARVMTVDGEGHFVPVLLLDLRPDDGGHHHVRVEQPFPPGRHAACFAAARRYRKGMRVRVEAPKAWATLVLRRTAHVHIVQPTTEETTV